MSNMYILDDCSNGARFDSASSYNSSNNKLSKNTGEYCNDMVICSSGC